MAKAKRITIRLDERDHFELFGVYNDEPLSKQAIVLDMTVEQAMRLHDAITDKLDEQFEESVRILGSD